MGKQLPKGWGKPADSRKFHYFNNDSFCLCGKYGFYFGEAEDDQHDHEENCAVCKRKYAKLVQADKP